MVDPPSKEETLEILKGLRDRYEAHHRVRYSDQALVDAIDLSVRYVTGRFLPDKAIDVVDEAGARVRLKAMTQPPDVKDLEAEITRQDAEKEEAVASQDFERAARLRDTVTKLRKRKETVLEEWRRKSREAEAVVDSDVIAETVSRMTGVPLTRIEKGEAERLLTMETELHRSIVGQEPAVSAIARAVRRSRSGLKDPKRPMGSFIFLGPTGVGKTLLAKALAKFMFGNEDALLMIDMSEYMEKHNVSRLVGAPPGYVGYEEGGQLTERVRRRPYSVILFDEIEKAHHDVFNMLLQIMEEGRLTDSFGRHVYFRNTIIIMTSNIGSEVVKNQASLGFTGGGAEQTYEKMKENLQRELERHFRPEFLNRVDDVIVFKSLTRDDLKEIIDIELVSIRARLEERGVTLTLTDQAREFIIDSGSNLEFGARPLRRALERLIEDPLSEEILRGAFVERPHVRVKVKDSHLFFDATAKAPKGTKRKDDEEGDEPSPPGEPKAAASADPPA